MASDSNSRSLLKSPAGQRVGDLAQQRLIVRLAASQGEEADPVRIEIDLSSDQAVRPQRIDLEAMTQHLDAALRVGAPQEDEPTLRPGLQVQPPVLGEGTPRWGRLDPRRGTQAARGHELPRLLTQALERVMDEAGPDLRLPAAIVVLDGCLEAGLPRRGE